MSDIPRLTNRASGAPTTQSQLIKLMRERESGQQRERQQPRKHPQSAEQDDGQFHIDEYA